MSSATPAHAVTHRQVHLPLALRRGRRDLSHRPLHQGAAAREAPARADPRRPRPRPTLAPAPVDPDTPSADIRIGYPAAMPPDPRHDAHRLSRRVRASPWKGGSPATPATGPPPLCVHSSKSSGHAAGMPCSSQKPVSWPAASRARSRSQGGCRSAIQLTPPRIGQRAGPSIQPCRGVNQPARCSQTYDDTTPTHTTTSPSTWSQNKLESRLPRRDRPGGQLELEQWAGIPVA